MSTEEQQHENRVIGGHKSTLHNPNVSNEAKEHAIQILEAHGETIAEEDRPKAALQTVSVEEEQHQHRVLGGFKATLANPNTSEEAKEHARQVLQEAGEPKGLPAPHAHAHDHSHDHHGHSHAHGHDHDHAHHSHAHPDTHEGGEEHDHRVIGGYKAALHNPNVSEEAKANAREVLKEHGEQL